MVAQLQCNHLVLLSFDRPYIVQSLSTTPLLDSQ